MSTQGKSCEGGSPGPEGALEIHSLLHRLISCLSAHLREEVLLKQRSLASCRPHGISEQVSVGLGQGFSTLALLAFWTGSFSVVGTIPCPVGRLAESLALPTPCQEHPLPSRNNQSVSRHHPGSLGAKSPWDNRPAEGAFKIQPPRALSGC